MPTDLIDPTASIHKSSIIDSGVRIGARTKIWHWCHISSGAIIGDDCSLGQNTFVSGGAFIGSNVRIQNNVSVYDRVSIEDDVFVGPSVVFTNVLNPRASVNRKDEYMRTMIQKGATLGANCTIVCGVTIGNGAFIAAGAVITKSVKPFALMAGVPAKQMGWMSQYGHRIQLPLSGSGQWRCDNTGEVYILESNQLVLKRENSA